ncbi:MAG: membrane protein insertase YidC [Deltaproteobacteria bacterium]|nr:membrane protein insertase YidC [Deltaproteobacteria bacterium]
MEKRTILAFVLSFLVLIFWSYFFSPRQDTPSVKEESVVEEKEGISGEKKSDARIPEPAPSQSFSQTDKSEEPVIADKEKEIIVDTPYYKAIFSSRNAAIKSFRLKKYRVTKDPESPLIEMVNLIEKDDDYFEATFKSMSAKKEDAIYKVNHDSISLKSGSSPAELIFSYTASDGTSVDQIYRFYPNKYDIDLKINISNNSASAIEGNICTYIRNRPLETRTGNYSFVGVALLLDDNLEEIKPKKMKKEEKALSGSIKWVAYENDYFIASVIPENNSVGSFNGKLMPSGTIQAEYITASMVLNAFEKTSSFFTLFIGPRDVDILRKTGKDLDKAINFGFFDIIAKPLHFALRLFNRYINNYGVSIILITILIKIIFWPLTHKSYKSMKEMQKLQPLMAKIREKHKNNKEQMNRELMSLYKTYKINPMGGCLPMVIQIPVFFALFRILGSSIELRQAPFILWITDLSAPDRLFNFPFSIPLMAPPYGIPVLTLLMGASMFIQQKMTPTPGDPAQAKMMMLLPIVFTFMFINFPSGLVLYWLTNNILSIGQQYRIKKRPA